MKSIENIILLSYICYFHATTSYSTAFSFRLTTHVLHPSRTTSSSQHPSPPPHPPAFRSLLTPTTSRTSSTIRPIVTNERVAAQYYNYRNLPTSTSRLFFSNNDENNNKQTKNPWDGIVSLWDEIIEISTYGPSERKMLKAQRERQKQLEDNNNNNNNNNIGRLDLEDNTGGGSIAGLDDDDDQAWIEAFTAATTRGKGVKTKLDYDGYALQDLLVSKWGVSLDVDFQRIGNQIYCTVLPQLGYGSPLRSRHDTELDYLMHLQGVVEVLHKYDNLDGFISFVETTNKVPKRGTDSVPFRLNLNNDDLDRILQ